MQPTLAAFDPDLAFPTRKPQFTNQFDPRWAISFYHGLGSGPYALTPYVSRGKLATFSSSGTISLAPRQDGWSLAAAAAATSAWWASIGAAITWAPSQVAGTCVFAFRALAASGADSNARSFHSYGDVLTANYFQSAVLSTTISAGWGSGLISASRTGLWNAGDLVVIAISYNTNNTTKQTLYVNGASVATGTGTPVNSTGSSTNALFFCGLSTASESSDWPLIYTLWADRDFSPTEIAWIAKNPLNWMFAPGPITAALRQSKFTETGTATLAFGGVSYAASAAASVPGTASLALKGVAYASSGTAIVTGTVGLAFQGVSYAAAGIRGDAGAANLAFKGLGISAAGTLSVVAGANLAFSGVSISVAGRAEPIGAASLAFSGIALSSSGVLSVPGAANLAFRGIAISGTGALSVPGSANLAFAGVSYTVASEVVPRGAANMAFAGIAIQAAGATSFVFIPDPRADGIDRTTGTYIFPGFDAQQRTINLLGMLAGTVPVETWIQLQTLGIFIGGSLPAYYKP